MRREKRATLARLCRLFGVSRQSYYQSRRTEARRAAQLRQIKPLVERIRRRMPRLGGRKLYHLLKDEMSGLGIKIGRDALFDYLRAAQLLVRRKKNYTKTTDSKHWLKKHPNLAGQMKVNRAEQLFVSDITYLKTRQRTHYLALVTDAYSRRIMGYQVSDDLSAENAAQALLMAVRNRKSRQALVHHSDRGLQYCSAVYQKQLKENHITASMTDGADCYQNALAERVNGILKQEFLIEICQTGEELKRLINEAVEIYNNERPHLSLGMKTPDFIHKKACESNFTGSLKII